MAEPTKEELLARIAELESKRHQRRPANWNLGWARKAA